MNSAEQKITPIEEADVVAETTPPVEAVTPTWFSQTYPEAKPEDMAERYVAARIGQTAPPVQPLAGAEQEQAYEAYRRRLEDRFQVAKQQAKQTDAPTPRQPRASQAVTAGGAEQFRTWQDAVQARQANHQRPAPRRPSATRIAALLAMACGIGGAAGYGTSQVQSMPNVMTYASAAGSALLGYLPSGDVKTDIVQAPVKNETVISTKTVGMARVDVQDTKGTLNGPIPLNIAAFPADGAAPLALRITGIPDDAYLTKGVEISAGEWLLKSTDVADVQLVVPQSTVPKIDLAVAAEEEGTGVAAAPPREMTVDLDLGKAEVVPANAAPESQSAIVPPPLETSIGQAQVFIEKGEKLMQSGDVISARQFFIKADEFGSADAAYWVGQTYDPMVYDRMNVRGLKPDAAEAKVWYEKAAAAGSAEAQAALQTMIGAVQP